MIKKWVAIALLVSVLASGCSAVAQGKPKANTAVAAESFLADITRNVAGDRMTVSSLVPSGVDPHAFEPAPGDVAKVADSRVLVINGGGLEGWLKTVLDNAGGQNILIDASNGLVSRTVKAGEMEQEGPGGTDPHFWLDPLNAITYVQNIRDGLIQADPAGKGDYTKNAEEYIQQLKALDNWIQTQVERIPSQNRLLVTNHETFGYFADRYGFKIAGTIIPGTSSEASPSAQDMANLSQQIRATGAPAIFLETGSNPALAQQIAAETGVKVVTGLYTHSLSAPSGPASTYIDMLKYDTTQIVNALK